MDSNYAPNTNRRPVVRRVLIGVGIAGALATAFAFRSFFARPGEGALKLIPKNAVVFGTVDLSPSPSQTLVFKKIDDALTRNGLDKKLDGALTDIIAHGPVSDELRPYSKRAAAFAMIGPETPSAEFKPEDSMVAFFSVTDGKKVGDILAAHGRKMFWKGTPYYQLDSPNGPGMMVFGDTLAVAANGKALNKVEQVAEGKAPSIEDRPDFIAERQKIDADANLMVFVAPEAFELFAKDAPPEAKDILSSNKWLALGVAVRDGGIALSYNGSYDKDQAKWIQPMASIAPIRADLFAVLPKGAYSVNAISQPSKYFDTFETAVAKDKEGQKVIHEMESSLAKEANISLRQDLLPAFQGNAIVAMYPSESSDKVAGFDALVVIDDQNGAKAGALAERLREFAEREIEKDGTDKPFEVSTSGDVKKYRLVGEAERSLQDSLNEGFTDDSPLEQGAMTKDKTITWAIVGNTVVASSSAKLLDRALATLANHEGALSSDSRWASADKTLLNGSQIVASFSIARIAEGLENTIRLDRTGDDGKTFKEIIEGLKSLTEPFSIRTKIADGRMSVGLFIPMDYDRLLDLIGKNIEH